MFHPSGNGPAVARLRIVFLGANREPDAALDQVSGLFVRMRMARQHSAIAHSKLGHKRILAVNQGLPFNPRQGRTVSSVTLLLEHAS